MVWNYEWVFGEGVKQDVRLGGWRSIPRLMAGHGPELTSLDDFAPKIMSNKDLPRWGMWMRNWIVRQGAPSVEVRVDQKTVFIKSRRRISIARGDPLLLLNPEWVFTHRSRVVDTKRIATETEAESDGEFSWQVEIEGWESLAQPVELDLFSASLTFVRNWSRARAHLSPSYRTRI